MINNFSIENFLDLTNYVTDARKKRRKVGKFGGGSQEFDERTARKIMKKNLVCSDFFKWYFEHWRPMQD